MATTWINLEYIVLSESSHAQMGIHCTISPIGDTVPEIVKFRDRKQNTSYQGQEEMSFCLVGRILVWSDENILEKHSDDDCTTV